MNNNNENESFTYSYSAKEQAEIQKIRNRYIPREESSIERLRRLDRSTVRKGMIASLTLGIIGALMLGTGMSLCMVWEIFLPGILIGISGILLSAFAYPVYNLMIKREREKIAPEIIRLTDELLK